MINSVRRARIRPLRTVVAFAAVNSLLTVGFGRAGTRAQEDEESHPAHIHAGTCENLGDVVDPLSNVGAELLTEGTPMAGARPIGSTAAVPVEASVTTVNAKLSDIADGNHAINVHESAAAIGNDIACGDVGGRLMGDDLLIGLGERNDSGYVGVARLHPMGDTTVVTVYLLEQYGETGEAGGTPEAGASANPVDVTLAE